MASTVSGIETNLHRIRECVARSTARVGRQPEDVTIIGVSKTHPVEAIRAAYEAGIRHFGENRVQELGEKFEAVRDLGVTWHLIGHLQSNKLQRALKLFQAFDSLDSIHLAQKLDASLRGADPLPVLIEVRTDAAATKSGVLPGEVPHLVEALLGMKRLELRGLMTIPAYFEAPDAARPFFREVRVLRDSLARRFGHPLPVLSMGMSHDFEAAIEEGSTEVRIGTALFGAREQK